jgi:hypothetical protein
MPREEGEMAHLRVPSLISGFVEIDYVAMRQSVPNRPENVSDFAFGDFVLGACSHRMQAPLVTPIAGSVRLGHDPA